METVIYNIPTRRPRTQGEIRQRRKMGRLMIVSAVLVVVALVIGIIIGSQFVGAYATAPDPATAPAPSPTEQMAGKLDFPSAAVLYAIAAAEKIQPPQVSEKTYECVFSEKTHSWDVPLAPEELDALLETCKENHIAPEIALGLIQVESSFRADAVNADSQCYGYCQLNQQYFPTDLSPVDNIRTGIGYLAEQLVRYENLEAALTAYNAGYDTGDRTYANAVLAAADAFRPNVG